ncbi:receptor-like protein EIX1 [Panicum virgatum]|uniref:Leucine-rich repeat-containing N-terminal plant-type domain-containing protein n=1 Tax=Panicum virgatum TaxID=38727 RepID=A0A8T0RTP6_PANVG|nr:receptor-like protein EIX1 [Panicum virgatum]KAG2589862.1 hypothetical protein PVAP13_5NG298400 [Panicum virgatum]
MGLLHIFIQIAIALLVFTHTMSCTQASTQTNNGTVMKCIAHELSALLTFSAGLSDPANLLSSWEGGNCCQWKGVQCSNTTVHVVKLDLQGPDCDNSDASMQVLGGKISSSLIGLQHLQYLDLSCNRFNNETIPEFLGSLHGLRYLDLSLSSFVGRIPPQLGNLSNLRYLNLDSVFGDTHSMDITWLSRLSSLQHLDMSWVNLSTITNWVSAVNKLPSLVSLDLSFCHFSTSPDSLLHSNLTSLESLRIEANNFHKRIAPNWFWDLPSLKQLDVSSSQLHGPFPNELGNMTSLVHLDLSENNLVGMLPSNLKNLCNLEDLYLFENNINGSITEFFNRLPSCSWNKFKTLFLPLSNLTGSLPAKLEPFRNLTWLDLGDNKLTGPVPLWVGKLTNLAELDLSSNNLDGALHEGHLSGLVNLERLSLADNSIAIRVNSTWVPLFNLTVLELGSCLLGPKFPTWLRWQTNIYNLDISNTSISDMVPDWFWTMASSVDYLNMRTNQISGFLSPKIELMRASAMDLSSNQFSGPIPKLPINLTDLDLSRNNLYGPLPLDFGAPRLGTLFLYDNLISGTIPSSLCKLRLLRFLDLSGNKLTGTLPDCQDYESTTNMTGLNIRNLSLRNNNLSGEFPLFLQYCQQLIFLDLSDNQFFGTLDSWIGNKLPSLAFMRLRHNKFCGHIPLGLTNLINLQYLDLAYNNLSGIIPKSIVNWKGMALRDEQDDRYDDPMSSGFSFGLNEMMDYNDNVTVVTKGQEQLYTGEIVYMVNLDLSCNDLTGEIPAEISTLVALNNLNLSWNAFSGKIPEKIGDLVQVESLDLSHNELSGEIPTSLSALTYLSHLNLSYNNLSGKIPSGNQLQVLDDQASIYVGNPGLCGPPLTKKCPEINLTPAAPEDHKDGSDKIFLFLGMSSGFVMGLWSVSCIFLLKTK